LVVLMLVCVGCQWQLKPADTDAAGKRIGIQRFDRIEMLYLTTGDYSALQQMNTYFPTETRMLIEDMLHLGQVDDPAINTKFLYFFQDSTLQTLIADVEDEYADIKDLNHQLSSAFRRLNSMLPDMQIPHVYTQIGSLDQSIIVTDSLLGISLDKYLGSDYPAYIHYGYSQKQRDMMSRQYIVPDCLGFYLLSLYPMPANGDSLQHDQQHFHMCKIQCIVNKAIGQSIFSNDTIRQLEKYMHKHRTLSADDFLRMTSMPKSI
jgi:hypothetical protein